MLAPHWHQDGALGWGSSCVHGLQRGLVLQEQHATPADSLAFLANQIAATHFREVPFCFHIHSPPNEHGC